MSVQNNQYKHGWWLGMADMLTQGVGHGVMKLERVHLAIADETFGILERVPVTQPWSRVARVSHHGISRLCYRSVSLAATGVGLALGSDPKTFRPVKCTGV